MADNSYTIEIKTVSKNGWFTPAEARSYYGRYDRSGITLHWWNTPDKVAKGVAAHNGIVSYFAGQAEQGIKSVNYVVSDYKISLLVGPDNVAWCSESGNPTTVSIECDPHLGVEGYKRLGWLIDQLEQRYNRSLSLYRHSNWNPSTACCGTISEGRARQEANNWKSGAYEPKPTPIPAPPVVPPSVVLEITDIPNRTVQLTKDSDLWDLHFGRWADAKSVKKLAKGTQIEVSAIAKHPLGGEYYLSEYSFSKGIGNGVNVKDCVNVNTPPVPSPAPEPTPPVEVPIPVPSIDERVTKLEKLVGYIVQFLSNLFTNFKPN